MARKRSTAMAVGHYTCPNPIHKKPTLAVIRMKTNGTLFGYCGEGCGMTDWNLKRGQRFFTKFGIFWPAAEGTSGDKFAPRIPPADLPMWIRDNRSWAPLELQGGDDDDEEEPDPKPAGDPAPTPDPPAVDPAKPKPDPEPKPPKAKARKKIVVLGVEIDDED